MSLLEVKRLVAGYSRVPVLHEIDLQIDEGQLVAVLGANGAGKSTLMRTIAGLNHPISGSIRLDGREISRAGPAAVARAGIAHVPEGHRVFAAQPVEQNLLLGAYLHRRERTRTRTDLRRIYEKFPILEQRRSLPAATLSGGERQLLAIAMALMARARLLMLDEPSLGLAPLAIRHVFDEIDTLRHEGTTILLSEQLANLALHIADRGIVLHLGRAVAADDAASLQRDRAVLAAYLGS